MLLMIIIVGRIQCDVYLYILYFSLAFNRTKMCLLTTYFVFYHHSIISVFSNIYIYSLSCDNISRQSSILRIFNCLNVPNKYILRT